MDDKILQAIDIKKVSTISLGGIILGSILTFIPMSLLVDLMVVIIGIGLIIFNGVNLYKKVSVNAPTTNDMLFDVLGVLSGVIILCLNSFVATLIIAIYLIAEPIIRIVLDKEKEHQLYIQLPKISIGIILLLVKLATLDLLFKVIGIVVLICSVGYFVYNYYLYKKSGVKIIK